VVAPDLDALARDENEVPPVKKEAAAAVKKLGHPLPEDVDRLIAALGDKDKEHVHYRLAAASSLYLLGPQARKAVPALGKALRDGNAELRAWAALVLEKMGTEAAEAAPDLRTGLQNEPSFEARLVEARALCAVTRKAAPEAVAVLLEALGREKNQVEAASAWAKLGPDILKQLRTDDTNKLAAALATALTAKADDPALHRWAAAALAQLDLGPAAVGALPGLLRALENGDAYTRAMAATTFGKIGKAARVAFPLLDYVKETDSAAEVQQAVKEALDKVGRPAAEDVPGLVKLLDATDLGLREAAGQALVVVGAEAGPALLTVLRSGPADARVEASRVLGFLGPQVKDAVTALTQTLQQTTEPIKLRAAAATALGTIGPAAVDAVPALTAAARDADAVLSTKAAEALEKIRAPK
jgi:HEAT repeat protein